MFKRSLLLIILSVCLVLSGGCGGSSKNSNGNSIVLSSDYAGYEVDYKLTYKATYTDYEVNPAEKGSFKGFHHIISINDAGIFKTADYNEKSAYKYGDYVKKQNSEYYDFGYWDEEEGEDKTYDDGYLMFEVPLVEGIETPYGKVLRSEKITLLGKTYDAWYIEDESEGTDDDGNLEYELEKIWFVPYIGEVRCEYIEKSNGKITFEGRYELSSAKFEAYKASKSLVFGQPTSIKADNQVQGTRNKKSRLFDREKF